MPNANRVTIASVRTRPSGRPERVDHVDERDGGEREGEHEPGDHAERPPTAPGHPRAERPRATPAARTATAPSRRPPTARTASAGPSGPKSRSESSSDSQATAHYRTVTGDATGGISRGGGSETASRGRRCPSAGARPQTTSRSRRRAHRGPPRSRARSPGRAIAVTRLARFTGRPYQSPARAQRLSARDAGPQQREVLALGLGCLDQPERRLDHRPGLWPDDHRRVTDHLHQPHRRLDHRRRKLAQTAGHGPERRRVERLAEPREVDHVGEADRGLVGGGRTPSGELGEVEGVVADLLAQVQREYVGEGLADQRQERLGDARRSDGRRRTPYRPRCMKASAIRRRLAAASCDIVIPSRRAISSTPSSGRPASTSCCTRLAASMSRSE